MSARDVLRDLARSSAPLMLALLASMQGPAQAAPRPPELHYRMTDYTFEVPVPKDDDHPAGDHRRVQWSYPVFADARDLATRQFNAWLRGQALDRLLPAGELRKAANGLKDREVMKRAATDPDFIDSELQEAVVTMHAAAGRYRSLWSMSSYPQEGSVYAGSDSTHLLYDMRAGRPRGLSQLFVSSADDAPFEALFQEAREADGMGCDIERHFDWSVAYLDSAKRIGLLYRYDRSEDPRCSDVTLDDPKIAGLLKDPGQLEPDYKLVDDGARR